MSPAAQLVVVVLLLYFIVRVAANVLEAVRRDSLAGGRPSLEDDEPVQRTISGQTYHQVWHVGGQKKDDCSSADIEEARWREV